MKRGEGVLSHWLFAAALILLAAALTIPQLDKYTISPDAIYSYTLSFGPTDSVYTAEDVMRNIRELDSNQGAFFHLLLHYWGVAAGHSLLAARLVSLFCGLLSLALVYRLGRDFVGRSAGGLCLILLLCNSFYAFDYTHVRYYTLVAMLSALVSWLYLRLSLGRRPATRRDYLAFALAGFALMITHAFTVVVFIALGAFHLLSAKRSRRWLAIAACALLVALLAAPQWHVWLTEGSVRAQQQHSANSDAWTTILEAWLTVISNGAPALLAISLVGAVIGWRRGTLRGNPFLLLFPLLVVAIGISSEASGVVSEGQMRYFLVGMPIVVCFAATGLYALYRLRPWLAILALLWVAAGLSFMQSADWKQLIQGRTWAYTHPPWHLVSRWMQRADENLPLFAFDVSHNVLRKGTISATPLQDHYFTRHGLIAHERSSLDIDGRIGGNRLERPGYWILFQHGVTFPATIDTVIATLDKYGYETCGAQTIPNNTEIITYRWKSLQCDAQTKATFATDAGDYLHYGAVHDNTNLLFAGKWQLADDASAAAWNISFQLLDADWTSHAQIDLPASSLADMRQFAFDLTDFAAGEYRLMAIAYHAESGERLAWHDNDGWIPEMRKLADIVIADDTA